MSKNAIELQAAVRAMRLAEHPMSLRKTIEGLEYIGDVDQPLHEYGGFHPAAILTARSALHQIERLRKLRRIRQ